MLILFFLRLFFYLSQFSSYLLILREKVEICRSIAHKHKDLHAQTSHQAQTSHHWRGISFHLKCLFITKPHVLRLYSITDCRNLPNVENGTLLFTSTLYEDVAFLTCDVGFSPNINAITCTSNGVWSGVPECIPVGRSVRQAKKDVITKMCAPFDLQFT